MMTDIMTDMILSV